MATTAPLGSAGIASAATDRRSPSGAPARRPIRRRRVRRIGWAIAAVLLLGGTIFEAAKHGGAAVPLAVLGLILPDLTFLLGLGQAHEPGRLPRSIVRAYNVAHHPLVPVIPLIALSLVPGIPGDSAALFTFFLAWLTHIAVDRAAGYGRRNPDGSLPAD